MRQIYYLIINSTYLLIYLAEDREQGSRVVIKTLKDNVTEHDRFNEIKAFFDNEAEKLGDLSHPKIVEFKDSFPVQVRYWEWICIVMEYVEGKTLEQYVKEQGSLDETKALHYIKQIGNVLAFIHGQNLVHRDINPRNIIVRMATDEPVLIDFGLARKFRQGARANWSVGYTSGYAPPEQHDQTTGVLGDFIDVYALAATLYYLLTGQEPVPSNRRTPNDVQDVLNRINHKISDRVIQAILQGMELDSKRRPRTVQDWLKLLSTEPTYQGFHNIPQSTAREFVGRMQELGDLHQLLQDNDVVAITDVTGQGGVGKTELAIQYSSNYLEEYPGGCCWLFPRKSDLETQLVDFAVVNFPDCTLPTELSLIKQVGYCLKKWPTGNALVVLDDVSGPMQIEPYLKLFGSQFKVLITTRQQLGLEDAQLPLGELQPDAALELLAKLLGEELVKQQLEFARKLCEFVNYKPLGLYQIAAIRS